MFTLVNDITIGAARSKSNIQKSVVRDSSGAVVVRLTGTYAADAKPLVMSVNIDDPALYAARALLAALRDRGITVNGGAVGRHRDVAKVSAGFADATRVAEHVSLPLSEEVKVTLKVSQNLHASAFPYVIGALASHETGEAALQAGFDAEREWLTKAGLDLTTAGQSDGAGGATSAFFSPSFMVQYLAYMASRPDIAVFRTALPILGRDGTLWNIQPQSAAAGKVFAKTGTYGAWDRLNERLIITGKGLAGYMTTSAGRHLAFAIYGNRIPFPHDYPGDGALLVGQALGEIAVAMWSDQLQ
jgi:D-alanyl-D-alanine carboxypeptidase/D-alanyl-D-alanine-endopeptidase (penicillin-binding protein 4)